jgi:pyrroline-5-carboxylate reductase
MKKLAMLGAGNMAGALVKGLLETKRYRARDIWVSDADAAQVRRMRREYGVDGAPENRTLVAESEVVVLAVKPQILSDVMAEIAPEVTRRQLFVSIAAGFTLARLQVGLGAQAKVVRVMPNTPALVGAGMSVFVRGARAKPADGGTVTELFGGVGAVVQIKDESLMDAVTGLSGSGPAYVYRFAEGLIAGAVAEGLDERLARQLTYQTIRGAALMLQETGRSPEELRAMVTSPGGTTLAGLQALDAGGFVSNVSNAVAAATHRSRELGKG